MTENEKICTVAYVKLQEEKVLLHKAKMLMCNSQWDIHHTLKSNVYKQIRNYILNGKSILREKESTWKGSVCTESIEKWYLGGKKCLGCMFVKNVQRLSKLIYYRSLSSRESSEPCLYVFGSLT